MNDADITAAREALGERQPVCGRCKDTHRMMLRDESRGDREVMCTSCPTPCPVCRGGGSGPFCESTPCGCECHAEVPDCDSLLPYPPGPHQSIAELARPLVTGADRARAQGALGELGQVTSAVGSVARAIAAERRRLVHLSRYKHDPNDPSDDEAKARTLGDLFLDPELWEEGDERFSGEHAILAAALAAARAEGAEQERARMVHLACHKHGTRAGRISIPVSPPCERCKEWEQIKRDVFAIPGKAGP